MNKTCAFAFGFLLLGCSTPTSTAKPVSPSFLRIAPSPWASPTPETKRPPRKPADKSDCIDANDAAALEKDFNFLGESGKWKADLCNQKSTGYYTMRALLFLKNLPALDATPSEYNQNLIQVAPYEFFRQRVKNIVVVEDPNSDSCSDARLAYVSPVWREEKRIWVCPNALHYDLVTYTSALVHESRHEEGDQFNHVQCFDGPYAGQFSCDDTYAAGGSYAVGLEYLVKLAHTSALPAEIRATARRAAVMDFLQRFNTAPLDVQAGALLRQGNDLVFFDGNKTLPTGLSVTSDAVVTLQAGLPMIYSPSRGTVQLFSFQPQLGAPVSDVLTRYFLDDLKPGQQKDLLDVEYSNAYACLLLRTGLECYAPDRSSFSVPIQGFVPKQFLYSMNSRLLDPSIVLVLDEGGYAHQLPAEAGALKSSTADSWPKSKATAPWKAIQPWDGGEISLSPGGALSAFDYHERKWQPLLEGQQFQGLLAPFFWSTKLQSF